MSTPGPELRIGDAEREAAVTALGEHFASGRLTKEEYDERAERAFAARTRSDLWPLFADLPRPEGATGATRPDPAASGGRPRGGPSGGRPAVPARAWLGPLLLVLIGLTVLTHLPVFLLFFGALFLWRAFGGGHGAGGCGGGRGYGRHGWVR